MGELKFMLYSLIFLIFSYSSLHGKDEELDCNKSPVCKSDSPPDTEKFYFDIHTESCERMKKSDCEGLNNFENHQDCDEACRETYFQEKNKREKNDVKGKEVCKLDKEIGPCKALILVYYFNNDSHQCETFHFGGCKGNGNNFNSMEECKSLCG